MSRDVKRFQAEFYGKTSYVPPFYGLLQEEEYTEAELWRAWDHYSSKRPSHKMADTVKNFFAGDAQVVILAQRLGLPLSSPDTGRPENPKLEEAKAWLQNALQNGFVQSKNLFADARNSADIHAETLRRAGKELGIVPQKRGGFWFWQLPVLEATASVEESED